MAVDDVVLDAFFTGEVFDTLDKLRNVICQFLFGHRMFWSCGHVHNAIAITELVQHMRHMIILGAREDIHVNAHVAELTR